MMTTVDLNKPYVGWLDHFSAGWQIALVRMEDGRRKATRLGSEVPKDQAEHMCRMLGEVTGVQVAGELSKRGFLPVGMTSR